MPPAKLSPAPVGSMTFSVGNAGSTYVSCSQKNIAPCSPFLMTTNFGPISRTRWPASTRFSVSASILASLSLITRPSMPLEQRHQIGVRGLNPQLHRVGHGEPAAGHLVEHFQLQ